MCLFGQLWESLDPSKEEDQGLIAILQQLLHHCDMIRM